MHARAALGRPAVLAARIPRALPASLGGRRTLGSGPSGSGPGSGPGPGGKPADGSEAKNGADADAESQKAADTCRERPRGYAAASSRSRDARRHVAAALPPVELPRDFLDNNVCFYSPSKPPRPPMALAEDAGHDKTSQLFCAKHPPPLHKYACYGVYFEKLLDILLCKSRELTDHLMASRTANVDVETLARTWDMILDAAWHLADALYPARRAEYTYKMRPLWWWHFDKNTAHHFWGQPYPIDDLLKSQLDDFLRYDVALPPAIADLPYESLKFLSSCIWHEFRPPGWRGFDTKTSRRQISVLSLSGFSGTCISAAAAQCIAFATRADMVRLDAFTLSSLVALYLGQNWAYARGAVSMMGFRAAELNGRLAREPYHSGRQNDDEDNDGETGTISIRTSSGTLEEEVQKAKYDVFTKWETLKIDKLLNHIIRLPLDDPERSPSGRILIHVHDLVELSMTLEGSIIIGRLRALVDSAWQEGIQIAILGTSSCEQPSEEYQQAVRDLAAGDVVVTHHLQLNEAGKETTRPLLRMQRRDNMVENLKNIHRMLMAMDQDGGEVASPMADAELFGFLTKKEEYLSFLYESLLPIPEVYNLARSFQTWNDEPKGRDPMALRLLLGPLREKPWQSDLSGERSGAGGASESKEAAKGAEFKPEQRPAMKLSDYEKRVAQGQIDRDSLRTTFADIHVPPETISALKLLTSLSLTRPDAFSYGVLAQDKIAGCLLYGPPGTGKTMLAKAVAKESGANMLELSGASINDKWVGESEKLIHAVFTLAKRLSPCVVFIDEADSLLASRSLFSSRGSHREHINQFLKEWDGMEETNAFIMVATNRPFDLDEAVLRRLPRKILVDLPLKNDRTTIMRLLLRGEALDSAVSLDEYAERTPHYSGSDLKNVCVAAAMAAVEEENEMAAKHTGPEPFRYPARRVLRRDHFERALKQIPASISNDMVSLKLIRKFDEEFGNRSKKAKKNMGFGVLEDKQSAAADETRVRH